MPGWACIKLWLEVEPSRVAHSRVASTSSRVESTRVAYAFAARSFLVFYLSSRLVSLACEQPLGSPLFLNSAVRASFERAGLIRWATHLGAFGACSVKPLEVFSSLPIEATYRLVKSKAEACQRLKALGAKRHAPVSAEQKGSESYPIEFALEVGLAIFRLVVGHGECQNLYSNQY